MAAAAPSPLASSVEKTNGAKLSRLLIDGGTKVLRNLFDHYHPPAQLVTNLNRHYGTLNDLLRDGYLRRPQWDKLFPSGGVCPDSRNFDITLLFLLLTNICGLSSPRGGWHRMPHRRDNSREANIARIKFYRNELYGHVTTTSVDPPTFSALWQEIGAALRGLGLNQAEIDRLKTERCGEEDYIDLLLEWADSEEDIKSQLKDVRQSQNKVQQTVDEVHKTQLENHEILQDSKVNLEEVRQVQTKTQQTVNEVLKTQLEEHKILQESKVKLEGVHQVQTKTQQSVKEVRKTQLEDHKILQESKVKLEGVHQVQAKTQQTVGEVRQTQLDDRWKLEEVLQIEKTTHDVVTESRQSQLEDSKAIQDTKSKVGEVNERLERLKLTFEQKVEDLEGKRENNRQDDILKKLAKIDTMKDVRRHTDSYVDGTRMSFFAKVESWLDDRSSPNRVMVICGSPGMGKSVISAVTCQKMLQAGRLAGSHFCQHDRARHRNPKVMLQSLASHLADSLPDYKKALGEKLSRNLGVEINDMELKDLFELLFEEPLSSLNDPDVTYLMVIDGIDESEYQGRNELLDVIAEYFKKLPRWIRFLVTTRPEVNIADRLKCLHPLQLEQNNEENLKDIHLFFNGHLSNVFLSEYQETVLQSLVQKSEGVMLYAYYLVDFIEENVTLVTPELLDSTLPSGISSVYHSYFKRLETELRKELNVTEEQFMNFLSAVSAAREPMPLGFLSKLLLSGTSPSTVQRKVKAAIDCVSALLPVQDGRIHFFHKSIKDWLIEKSDYGQHHFSVNEKEGHLVLSKLCIEELDDLKRKSVDGAHFTDTTKYALQHGVQHMLKLDEDARVCSLEDVVKKYCLDLELVYAKLCVSDTAASEDILSFQKEKCAKASFEELEKTLDSLLYLLRKHLMTLTKFPHAIFQTVLNEGGPELSSEAVHLLKTRYCNIPYIEFVHKKDLEALVKTSFQCFAEVACFDVSPQLDYMVCECQDGTIQLWSLLTGKQLWKRPAKVLKHYYQIDDEYDEYEPFRSGPSSDVMSFYRSVVFHPTENLVLPGILSHAYAINGDLKPLFLSSKCRFTVCSIAADKARVLTNCLDSTKSIIMWSLTDGSEITHFDCIEDILSFAWSRDGRLLALSLPYGSIRLVDVVDDFKTVTQITTLKECGMIKFSPDCQFLFCVQILRMLKLGLRSFDLFCFHVKVENDSIFPLHLFGGKFGYYPWEFESCSETGFLLGDPFCFPFKKDLKYLGQEPGISFVLNGQSALWVSSSSSVIEMLNLVELEKERDGCSKTAVKEVAFSLDGDSLYVVAKKGASTTATLMAWEISNEKWKAEKHVDFYFTFPFFMSCFVTVRGGVLLKTRSGSLELWNDELSECIRSWTDLGKFSHVIPISEERVICVDELEDSSKVIILDTASGDVSTISINGEFVACNSKCQLLLKKERYKLQMLCGEIVLWKISQPFDVIPFLRCNTFSPTGEYCVVGGKPEDDYQNYIAIYVLDVASGKILHRLCTSVRSFTLIPDCKFTSDEECVIRIKDLFENYFLKLFNVNSGELLSEISNEYEECSLTACPRTGLIAIGHKDSKDGFKVLKVKLPRHKDSKKNKSIELQD